MVLKVCPFLLDKDDKPYLSDNPSMFITLWDVKESMHTLFAGHGIPGVVVNPLYNNYYGWKGKCSKILAKPSYSCMCTLKSVGKERHGRIWYDSTFFLFQEPHVKTVRDKVLPTVTQNLVREIVSPNQTVRKQVLVWRNFGSFCFVFIYRNTINETTEQQCLSPQKILSAQQFSSLS